MQIYTKLCLELLIYSHKKKGMAYLSPRMEHVRNTGNALYCVMFEQQEMRNDNDDNDVCLSLLYSCMTREVIILSN